MLSSSKFGLVSAASLAALVGGAILLQLGGSALNILVPLEMALRAEPPILVGLVSSAYAAGFLIGCFTAALLARRVGHIRAFAIFAACQSTLALCLALFSGIDVWIALRFFGGFVGAGLAIIIDSWINGRTPRAYRGRVLAAYNIINRLAVVLGQLWPAIVVMSSNVAFTVIGALFSLALVPVSLTRTRAPRQQHVARLDVASLWRQAPISVVGCFYVGLINGALVGVLPAYGILSGFSSSAVGLLAAAVQLGALALQWPLGFASDQVDRRRIMLIATCITSLTSITLFATSPGSSVSTYAMFALIAGTALPIYSLAVAHAFDKFGRGSAVGLSSSLLFVWAAGAVAGPIAASLALQLLGANGLHLYLASLATAFGAFAAWRLTKSVAPREHAPFAAASQSSPVLGRTDDKGTT